VNLISENVVISELGDVTSGEIHKPESQSTILIIDDNPDVRTLVGSLFCDEYTVLEASNGTQGIQSAMYNIPDLIICDVMMPGIDGLECCSRLKSEVNTSHIPILMLTACSLDEQRVSGLNCGADAYLSKPFNSSVLIAQVKSLIENRRKVRQVFGDTVTISEENISSTDKDFMLRLKKEIADRIDDSELSVETLGDIFGMSRVQLYRKVKNMTNYTPVEMIRITRLKAAQQILASTDLTVAEVGYKVGFSSPSYFAKCYKEYFGEVPNYTRLRKK
jgi:DNA-binding response OmpR family regulator